VVYKSDSQSIIVWPFNKAPESLQHLSNHGGDEDWLALIPHALKDMHIPWLDSESFGCCRISSYDLEDGSVVKIGAHA